MSTLGIVLRLLVVIHTNGTSCECAQTFELEKVPHHIMPRLDHRLHQDRDPMDLGVWAGMSK